MTMTAVQNGKKKRTRVARKIGRGNHGGSPPGPSTGQGVSLGHGSPDKDQPKLPVTSNMGSKGGTSGATRQEVNREVSQFCKCTRHLTCGHICTLRYKGQSCTNFLCHGRSSNTVEGKPSPATAGLRSTLHRFLQTPENIEQDHQGTIKTQDADLGTDRAPVLTDPGAVGLKDGGAQDTPKEK